MQAATHPATVHLHPVLKQALAADWAASVDAIYMVWAGSPDHEGQRYSMTAMSPITAAVATGTSYCRQYQCGMVNVTVRRHSHDPADRPIWHFRVTVDDCGIPSVDPA